ncbi:MAG: DNA polymerase III subunit chi [Alphaproteobacteria bacterium]
MAEIRFYHLQNSTIKQALPALLQKVVDMGIKPDVIVPDDLNGHSTMLWESGDISSFLAHDSGGDINENSPISLYLSDGLNSQDLGKTRFFVNHIDENLIQGADLSCLMFNGNDARILSNARNFWKSMQEKGNFELVYYYQDANSGWQKK